MIGTLCATEFITAATIGIRRRGWAMATKQEDYGHVDAASRLDIDIKGALAEYIVSRVTNQRWPAHIGKTDAADVGDIVEVRCRRIPGTGTDLAIRPHDKIERPFVLVHAHADFRFDVRGWLWGKDAKARGGPWCEPKGCWYIPPPYEPIESLIAILKHGAAA